MTTGSRGYALPVLRRRHNLLTASLLLVPIWAGWQLPLFFQNSRSSVRATAAAWVPVVLVSG